MEKILFKHTGLPILDMFCSIDIEHDLKRVTFDISHFDSALVIDAARHIEREHAPVRVIDVESAQTWGPARIPNRYALHLVFDGRTYEAEILKLALSDGLTVALRRRDSGHEF